jgi:hypothetical protein
MHDKKDLLLVTLVESLIIWLDTMTWNYRRKIDPTQNPEYDYLGDAHHHRCIMT